MEEINEDQNKIANHKVDDLYNIWLGIRYGNITFCIIFFGALYV